MIDDFFNILKHVPSNLSRLQEFITQDRKREKSAVRSASPVKPTNVPTDITEVCIV